MDNRIEQIVALIQAVIEAFLADQQRDMALAAIAARNRGRVLAPVFIDASGISWWRWCDSSNVDLDRLLGERESAPRTTERVTVFRMVRNDRVFHYGDITAAETSEDPANPDCWKPLHKRLGENDQFGRVMTAVRKRARLISELQLLLEQNGAFIGLWLEKLPSLTECPRDPLLDLLIEGNGTSITYESSGQSEEASQAVIALRNALHSLTQSVLPSS